MWLTNISSSAWSNNHCPTSWRMPTKNELEALLAGSTWAAANARGNAVAGRFCGSNHATCTMSNPAGCIFLPASGMRDGRNNGNLATQGSAGYYWSTSINDPTSGWSQWFGSNNTYSQAVISINGMNIRCVHE